MTVLYAAKVSTLFLLGFIGNMISTGMLQEATVWNNETCFFLIWRLLNSDRDVCFVDGGSVVGFRERYVITVRLA